MAKKKWKEHSGIVLDTVNDFDVIDCEYCGFKHIIPIPTAEELEEVYREDYYTKEKPLYIERSKEDEKWWDIVYEERYEIFEELLKPGRRRILDVGSGPGFFLAHGKKRGWNVTGIEPSSKAAKHARSLDLNIIENFLSWETAKQMEKYDVVHMSKVLEHIPNPIELIEVAKDLLDIDGLIYVDVPNDYSPFQKALRVACDYKPWWVAPPHHINYFDFDSLSTLLKKAGFKITLKTTTFPIDMFLLMGDNYIGNDKLGRQCHGKRKEFEQNLEEAGMRAIKAELYKCFAQSGIGREVVLIARKV